MLAIVYISSCCQQLQKRKIKNLQTVTHNMKEKKPVPRQFWLNLVIFAAGMIALMVVIRPWQTVREVTVHSATIPASVIATDAQVSDKTPIWRVTGQTGFIAQQLLRRNHQLDSAQVTLTGQQLIIDVVEKVTAGYVQKNGQWQVIDRNGHQRPITAPKGDAPVYAGFKSTKILQQVVSQFVGLELTMRQNISQITFSPTKDNANRLVIVMDDGNTVYASCQTFGKKISFYPGIAAQMPAKGIVDLQFGAYSHGYGSQSDSAQKTKDSKTTQTP